MIRIAAAAVLIVGAGLVHGAWTNRWGPSPALAALASRFESVPMVIGDWKGTRFELSARRTSHGRRDGLPGQGVLRIRAAGSPSRFCCSAASPAKSPRIRPTSATGAPATPWTLPLPSSAATAPDRPPGGIPDGPGGAGGDESVRPADLLELERLEGVVGAEEPRWKFATAPALCKLYVVRETAGAVVDPEPIPATIS